MLIKLKNKCAFTLAETLIAVGLIGILSAILIPVVTQSAPDQNKLMLKRAHHTLELAINGIINSSDAYPSNNDTKVVIGGYLFQRGFNYTTATSNGTKNKFCYFLTNVVSTIGTKTCPATSDSATWGTFTTIDGVYWKVYNPYSDATNAGITEDTAANAATYQFPVDVNSYTTKVVVDVNGPGKGDDCSTDSAAGISPYTSVTKCTWYSATACTKSPDTYIFGVRYDGKLQVGSSESSDFCSTTILSAPANNLKF